MASKAIDGPREELVAETRSSGSLNGGNDGAEELPPPPSNLAYAIMLLQGFGLLLPWNIVLNAIPYFKNEYPENANSVAFYLTAACSYSQAPLLLAMVYLGDRLPLNLRVISALAVSAGCMAALPLLAKTGMWTTLALAFISSVCTAVLQSSLFGLASSLPPKYAGGILTGQGLAGILASVAEVIVKASIPTGAGASGNQTAAVVYFLFAAATLGLCIAGYVVLVRMPWTQYYMRRSGTPTNNSTAAAKTAAGGGEEEGKALLLADGDSDTGGRVLSLEMPAAAYDLSTPGGATTVVVPIGGGSGADAGGAVPLSSWEVAKRVGLMQASVFIVFFLTFVVFPGVAPFGVSFKSSLGKISLSDEWWQTIQLLVFNIFDTCGRFMAGFYALFRGKGLLAASVSRTAFVVLFFGCAHNWTTGFNDVLALLNMVGFAFTNGYMASLAMIAGPQSVEPKDRPKAGFIMSFALQSGILAGSLASFGFVPPQT